MKVVAGVDSSTQSCIVVLRAIDSGKSIGGREKFASGHHPPVSEQHPHDSWSAFQIALRQAATSAEPRKEPTEVAAVSVDAQGPRAGASGRERGGHPAGETVERATA
jgi:sugar (pentulose or hexulose) kinase